MKSKLHKCVIASIAMLTSFSYLQSQSPAQDVSSIDNSLTRVLDEAGFTGEIDSQLEQRLIDSRGFGLKQDLADLGRNLFFDSFLALSNQNSCAGCHAPQAGFGDTQSIAIGVENNNVVGPNRKGPRNQRRTPMVLNNAFYPKLMWNGRFVSLSGNAFDNSAGFAFPAPEGDGNEEFKLFKAGDKHLYHLLVAQAHIPPTELPEMAGFTFEGKTTLFRESRFGGQEFTIKKRDSQQASRGEERRDGTTVAPEVLPHAVGGFFNEPIRGGVRLRLNNNPEYKQLFAKAFPDVANGGWITFEMIGQAIAEFELSLTFANAPIDRFKRGELSAMTVEQKRGALLFFGKARCVECHSVAGKSNEMFSDFEMHVIGVPQIAPPAPKFGGKENEGNVPFAGPGNDEDFGLEDITKKDTDRYKFRTSPLRNVVLQPTFAHNGAWTKLRDVIRHHLNPTLSARHYDPASANVARDLHRVGPIEPVLARLSPRLAVPIVLTEQELDDLECFVGEGLLDPDAKPESLRKLIPNQLPSGRPLPTFEGCKN